MSEENEKSLVLSVEEQSEYASYIENRFSGLEALSENVRKAVAYLIREAAFGLERWSKTEAFAAMTVGERIRRMCREGLTGMAKIS